MAEQIIIKISSTASGSGVSANQNITSGGEDTNIQESAKKPEKAGKTDSWKNIAKTMIVDNGRKVLQESINQFIDLTGNSSIKNIANGLTTAAGYATAIVAGGVVGAVAVAVDVGLKAVTSEIEERKANAQIDLLRQRVGSSLVNGGRGTYD